MKSRRQNETPEARKSRGGKESNGLDDFFSSLMANRLKLQSQINATAEKYAQLEEEGKEIQCMEDDEIRYYDKYGNYIMSEREECEEEDDEDDYFDDEESDESVDSDEGEIVFDEEAIVTTCAALKIRINESFIDESFKKASIDDSSSAQLETPAKAKSTNENQEIVEEYVPPSFESLSITTPSSKPKKPFIMKIRSTPLSKASPSNVKEQTPKRQDIIDICRNFKSENSYQSFLTTPKKSGSSESPFKTPTTTVMRDSTNTSSTSMSEAATPILTSSGKNLLVVKLFSPREDASNPNKKPRLDLLRSALKNNPK